MAQTENLKITKLNAADYVSVDPINEAFDKLDVLGRDYVVASGTSGEWWYIKYASGRAFCGIDSKSFGSDSMYPWGSLYSSKNCAFGAYPAEVRFTGNPHAVISNLTNNWLWPCPTANTTSLTVSPTFAMISAAKYDISDLRCGIFVSGRWK